MPRGINDPVALPAAPFILPDLISRVGAANEAAANIRDDRVRQAIAEAILYALTFGLVPPNAIVTEDGTTLQFEDGSYIILE